MINNEKHLIEKSMSSVKKFDGNILKVYVDEVKLPNGDLSTREVVIHPGAVAVVPMMDNGDIIFVRQFRYPIGKVLYEIPAGKLDKNEEFYDCALRELSEETGYIAENMSLLISLLTAPGFSNEVIHIYLAKNLKAGKAHPDEDEFLEVVVLSQNEIKEKIRNKEIVDAKTLVGIFLAGIKL